MPDYILLLGASLESGNRGISALTLGSIGLLQRSLGAEAFAILKISSNKRVETDTLVVNGTTVTVKTYWFSKYSFLYSGFEFFLLKIVGKKPRSGMSQLIIGSSRVFDINEGDSFSDIYGAKRIARHLMDSFVVLLSGKGLTFLPQTIGPFHSLWATIPAKYVLRRLDKIYVRDSEAAEFLNAWGIAYSKSPDVSVYMEPKSVVYAIEPHTIGVNVSGLLLYQGYGRIANRFSSYGTLVRRLIGALIKLGFSVLLIPHTYRAGEADGEDDLAAIREIAGDCGHERLRVIDEDYDAQELKYIISRTEFFIGSRMHSCLAALSSGVPTVGLSYSVKFRGAFEMFGQGRCVVDVCDMEDDDVDSAVARVIERIDARDRIREELKVVNAERERLTVE